MPIDGFEDYSTSWTVDSGTNTSGTSFSGAQSFDNDASCGNGDQSSVMEKYWSGTYRPTYMEFAYRETSSSGGIAYKVYDNNSNVVICVGSSNPNANVTGEYYDYENTSYKTWYKYKMWVNWANETYDMEFVDKSGTVHWSESGLPFESSANGFGEAKIGGYDWEQGNATPAGYEHVDDSWIANTNTPLDPTNLSGSLQ